MPKRLQQLDLLDQGFLWWPSTAEGCAGRRCEQPDNEVRTATGWAGERGNTLKSTWKKRNLKTENSNLRGRGRPGVSRLGLGINERACAFIKAGEWEQANPSQVAVNESQTALILLAEP